MLDRSLLNSRPGLKLATAFGGPRQMQVKTVLSADCLLCVLCKGPKIRTLRMSSGVAACPPLQCCKQEAHVTCSTCSAGRGAFLPTSYQVTTTQLCGSRALALQISAAGPTIICRYLRAMQTSGTPHLSLACGAAVEQGFCSFRQTTNNNPSHRICKRAVVNLSDHL